ncbi:MAG: helix-turn-helix domain-containing protein [Rhodospirillales bacterium]|nr:helix-turn-helix domain-containing protein [Rhodospirillales bacterium]
MTHYRTHFLDAIDAHRARHGMSRTRFGRKTMKDPTFVFRLEQGRNPRLDTVDRLLVEMGHEPVGPRFREEVRAFLAVTGMKRSEFGRGVNKNRSFATWLLDGGLPRLATMDKAHTLMAGHATPAQREAIRAVVEDGVPAAPVGEEDDEEIEMAEDGYMSTAEAAAYLKLSQRTLQSYRGSGKGPPFSRFGNRARYLRSRVVAWGREREARSTAEADEMAREAGKKDRGKGAAATPPDRDDTGKGAS